MQAEADTGMGSQIFSPELETDEGVSEHTSRNQVEEKAGFRPLFPMVTVHLVSGGESS